MNPKTLALTVAVATVGLTITLLPSAGAHAGLAGAATSAAAVGHPRSAPPGTSPPTTMAEGEVFGVGPSGTGGVWPDCPALTYADSGTGQCLPTATPTPPGTVALSTTAACPIAGDFDVDAAGNKVLTDPTQMRTLVECILPNATAWLQWEYFGTLTPPAAWQSLSGSLLPNNFLYVPSGVAVVDHPEGCSGGYDSADALFYCSVDSNVYLGEALLWAIYLEEGDAAIWAYVAHEMAHRVQHVANRRSPMSDNEMIPAENQADCFAGAFMDYMARHGSLDVTASESNDLLELFFGMVKIGELTGAEQSHGTMEQRMRAFYVGFNAFDQWGAFGCDFFLNDISIMPPESA